MEKELTALVVDDEVKITEVLRSYLEMAGFKVHCTYGGRQGLSLFQTVKPDVVVLDLMLPDISGEEICWEIRKVSRVPIIMLTAKDQEDDLVQGLALGADDYVRKPFSPKELIGRIKAVLRRAENTNGLLMDLLTFKQGYLVIDNTSHEVRIDGNLISLTPNEYKILLALAKNPNKVFTREELVVNVFGYDYEGQDRAVDTHVKNLRQKIEKDTKAPEFVLTVHGVGYKFGGVD